MNGHLLLLGVRGPELAPDEAALFRKLQPAGFILFGRNITSAVQTRKLTDDLRELVQYLRPVAAEAVVVHAAGVSPRRAATSAPCRPTPAAAATPRLA